MKKILIMLAFTLAGILVSGQATFKTNVTITKTTPTLYFNGTGGILDFNSNNMRLTHSTGVLTLSGGNFGVGSGSILGTGSIGATGGRFLKGWFTDLEITNLPTVGGVALKTALSLNNVTNESKATMFTNPTFTGTTSGITYSMVGAAAASHTQAQSTIIKLSDSLLDRYTKTQANTKFLAKADTSGMLDTYIDNTALNAMTEDMATAIFGRDSIFNVKDYGAIGDGINDDTEEIQAAIDAAKNNTVFIPSGDYLVSSLDVTNMTNIVGGGAYGVGIGGTRLLTTSADTVLNVYCLDGYPHYFSNFAIVGDGTAGQVGISINGMRNFVVQNVTIFECGSYGIVLGVRTHTTQVTIQNCLIQNNTLGGIKGLTDPENGKQLNAIRIYNNEIISNGYGMVFMGNNINIRDNVIQGNDSTGILLSGRDKPNVSSVSCQSVVIDGNYFENNLAGSVVAESYYKTGPTVRQTITNLSITNNHSSMTSALTGSWSNAHIIFRQRAGSSDILTFQGLKILSNVLKESGGASSIYRLDANGLLSKDATIDVQDLDAGEEINTHYAGLFEYNYITPIIVGVRTVPLTYEIAHVTTSGITAGNLYPVIKLAQSSAIDITTNPQIADGFHNQVIEIWGNSNINTLTLETGNGLLLEGGVSCVLGKLDAICLRYDAWEDKWIEKWRVDN